jgi:branched-chain amino acid transport system substrate-binding protein
VKLGRSSVGAAILGASLVLAACASEPTSSGEPSEAAPVASEAAPAASEAAPAGNLCPDGSIKIGIAKAKTGGFAFFDTAGANGEQVAFNEVNAAGGVNDCQYEVIWEDTASDPAQSGQAAQKLIDAGAKIIVLPGDFDIGAPASLAAQAAGVFAFSAESASQAWTEASGPNMVAMGLTELNQGKAQAKFATDQKWESAYIVTNEAFNFFKQMEGFFKENYAGTIVGRSTVAEDATDYSAVVSRIKSQDPAPSFIYLNDYFPHVGTFIKQLRDAGLNTPVLGNSTYASPAFAEVVGADRLAGVYYTGASFYEGPTADPQALGFVEAYKKAYGAFPENSNAPAGYQGVLLLTDALAKAGTTDAAAVTAAIVEGKDIKVAGSLIYDWNSNVTNRRVSVVSFDDKGVAIEFGTIDPR